MSRFRIHKSFEDELAQKADEFTLQPGAKTWLGVEKGIRHARYRQNLWKAGILGLSILFILGVLFVPNEENPDLNPIAASGIGKLTPALSAAKSEPVRGNEISTPPSSTASPDNEPSYRSLPQFSGPRDFEQERADITSYMETADPFLEPIEPRTNHLELEIQNSINTPVFKKRFPKLLNRDGWYVQVGYSPSYSYRNIASRTDYARPLEDSKKQYDEGIFGFSTRLMARYHFSNRFSLAFGLAYTEGGERIGMAPRKDNGVYEALAEEYGYEKEEMNSLGTYSYYTNRYSYFELPIMLYSKKPLNSRLSLSTGIGLSLGYMVSTNARCYDYRVDHYVNNLKFLNDWTVGSHAQALLEYSVNTRWIISAGPEVNYALLSTYRNYYSLSQHQFSVGMNVGLQWKVFDMAKSR